jgi:hypothetical protein
MIKGGGRSDQGHCLRKEKLARAVGSTAEVGTRLATSLGIVSRLQVPRVDRSGRRVLLKAIFGNERRGL